MKPITFAFVVLLATGTGSHLVAQSYDQLRQENQILRARIAALVRTTSTRTHMFLIRIILRTTTIATKATLTTTTQPRRTTRSSA